MNENITALLKWENENLGSTHYKTYGRQVHVYTPARGTTYTISVWAPDGEDYRLLESMFGVVVELPVGAERIAK